MDSAFKIGNGPKKLIATNPDLVRRFTTALLKGLDYAVNHPDEAGDILHNKIPIQNAKIAAAELTLMRPYVSTPGQPVGVLDPTRVAKSLALLKSVELIPSTTASNLANEIVNFDIAPKGHP